MWVKLRVRKNIRHKGILTHYRPGEWVEVGRQIAEEWLASGVAELASNIKGDAGLDATCGIVMRGICRDEWEQRLTGITGLQIAYMPMEWLPALPFSETLIYDPHFEPRIDNIMVGFKLLKKFQMAVPLWDYETLATSPGSNDEREYTQEIIRDLRVLLPDPRFIFARRCDLTRALFADWQSSLQRGDDIQLSLLRAIYTHKPIINMLPAEWTGRVTN